MAFGFNDIVKAGLPFGAGAFLGGSGGGGGDLYSRELVARRQNEISDFVNQLAGARSRYLTSLGNMYNSAYTRFSQNVEPGFANRGLSVRGGAFASALARESAKYQSELEPLAFQAEREDLNAAENLRANLFSANFNADASERLARYENSTANSRAIGGFVGQLGLMGLGAAIGGPAGAMVGNQAGNMLFSGDSSARYRRPTRSLNLSGAPGVY